MALVALGGAIGAALRVLLAMAGNALLIGEIEGDGAPPTFHWLLTLSENIIGAFLLALLITALPGWNPRHAHARLFLGTGVLGSFTTFSALSADAHALGAAGGTALMFGSVIAGLLAAFCGAAIGRRWAKGTPTSPSDPDLQSSGSTKP